MTSYDALELDFAKWRFEMYGTATLCDGDNLATKYFPDYDDEDLVTSEWIKCSDRMPEEDQGTVIGWNTKTGEVGEYFYDSDEVDCFSYYNFCGCHSFNADVVTHWMPLPPPPTE